MRSPRSSCQAARRWTARSRRRRDAACSSACYRSRRRPRRPRSSTRWRAPPAATSPLALRQVAPAMERLALAYRDFLDGKAPLVLLTGGSVHPPGTPYNEGVMMADELVGKGVPRDRLLIDPWARHSTTNL